MEYRPLAEIMRPNDLESVIGQEKLTKKGGLIYELLSSKQLASLILWGPSGSGKTTLARIIAQESSADFIELSAVSAGKAEVLKAVNHAKQNLRLGSKTILFVDEIHRFNKAQQDTLLPYIEDGTIVLIGATTENPSFEVISPLISRSRVLILEQLNNDAIAKIVKNALKLSGLPAKMLPPKSLELLVGSSNGDARVALNNLELAISMSAGKTITTDTLKTVIQKRLPSYDKGGEMHYNLISAFIKSMRGSDTKATLYWLARMLDASEDPKFIARRMVVFASEDIGLSGNGALSLAVATLEAIQKIGLPEAKYNLYHCAVALSRSKKSREITDLMHGAESLVTKFPSSLVPLHLRNATSNLMKELGYGKGTAWSAGFKHPKGFLPQDILDESLISHQPKNASKNSKGV